MSARATAFQAHDDAQRRAWAKLTPLERLRWLQQAKEFSRRYLGAAARKAPKR